MVDEKNIRLVVDGFKTFFERARETGVFNPREMKNFMEPIFSKAGYRTASRARNGILILHEADAGDFVTMSAAIREIRRIYPSAHITLVVEKRAGSLAECCPHVDEVLVESFRVDGKLLQGIPFAQSLADAYAINLAIAEKLLRNRIDIAFATVKSIAPTTPLLAYMSGARERVSHAVNAWEPLLTANASKFYGSHIADITLACIEELIRAPIINRKLEAWFTPRDLAEVRSMLPSTEKFYAVCLGAGKPIAHYPPELYARLIELILRADDSIRFVLLGGPTDIEAAKILMSNVDRNKVIDLVGKISFRQTAAAISLCEIYIGNDTGAMHLAAATNTPVLTPNCFPLELLERSNYLRHWYPYGVPSVIVCPEHALDGCKDSQEYFGCRADHPHCIAQIKPEFLFEALDRLFDRIKKNLDQPLVIASK